MQITLVAVGMPAESMITSIFINNNGLLKADLSGVVQRIWGSHRDDRPSFETELTSPLIALPRSPAPTGSYPVKCGDIMLLSAHDSESFVAFEPEHDRWYGPCSFLALSTLLSTSRRSGSEVTACISFQFLKSKRPQRTADE